MRVVIAEDSVLLASGLELLLASRGFEVAAVAADGPGFLEAVDAHRPGVTIVDVRLPPSFRDEGIHAALTARRRHPGLPVLVLSQYVEREYARELLADPGGGIGYLLKDRVSRVGEFTDALRRVADGGSIDLPRVVPVRASGIFHGDGWMGVRMRDASVVKGVGVLPMFAGLVGLLLLLGAFAATWVREGR